MLITEKFDVRPHPHIGLATVTYIYDGAIVHRDSVGSVQEIRPGDVNWMTAGRGIAHSERAPAARTSGRPGTVGGFQTWVALPKDHEEASPTFFHHGKDALPVIGGDGATVRLIVGSLYGERAPVETFSEMFYADVAARRRARSCRSTPTTRSGRSFMLDGQRRDRRRPLRAAAGCWSSVPATGWRSRR